MDEKTGEIMAIYVDQNAMSKGVGSALLDVAKEFLKENGFTKALLWVLSSNIKSQKWYENRGWLSDGKTKSELVHDVPTEDTRYVINL